MKILVKWKNQMVIQVIIIIIYIGLYASGRKAERDLV